MAGSSPAGALESGPPSYWDLCLLGERQEAQTTRLKFSVRTSRHASVCYSQLLLANKKTLHGTELAEGAGKGDG